MALKMKNLRAFNLLKKSLILQRIIKLINKNFGGANFKMLLFGTWCTN